MEKYEMHNIKVEHGDHESKEIEDTHFFGRNIYEEEGINYSETSTNACAPHNVSKEKFLNVKTENVDITEQFIDEIGGPNGEEYNIKSEHNHASGLQQQIGDEDFCFNRLENKNHRETNNFNIYGHGSTTRETKEQRRAFLSNEKREECLSSEFEANNQQHLKKDLVHLNMKLHECDSCDYATNRKRDLNRHTDSVHLNMKRHKCHLCDFAAVRKSHLKYHINSAHLKLKQYKCNLCDYASNKRYCIKDHVESVHLKLKQHQCDLCDYATAKKSCLKNHLNSVHSDLKRHKCKLCDYAANRKDSLKSHIDTVHLNLKPHKCDFCDYSATRKVNVKNHIDTIHLNLKQYKCHLCNYAANQKGQLKNHILSVHSNTPA